MVLANVREPETPIRILLRALPTLTHGTDGFMPHPKVQCLAQGHKCHDWDLNPNSADQSQQSLSLECSYPAPVNFVFAQTQFISNLPSQFRLWFI